MRLDRVQVEAAPARRAIDTGSVKCALDSLVRFCVSQLGDIPVPAPIPNPALQAQQETDPKCRTMLRMPCRRRR